MGKLNFPGFRVPPFPNIKDAKGGREHLCQVSPHLVRMQGQMPPLKTTSGQRRPWVS